MKAHTKTTSVLTALALLSTPVCAQAADKAASQQNTQDSKAIDLFNQGVTSTKTKDWQAARKLFLESWKLSKRIETAANLGWAEYELKLYRDAAEHLDYFLKNTPDDTSSARLRGNDMFEEARRHVAALKIYVSIPGAEIFVNNRSIGVSPLKYAVFTEPGTLSVEARKDGYQSSEPPKSFEVAPGALDQEIHLKLEKDDRLQNFIFYVGGSLTVGGAITTGVLAGIALGNRDSEENPLYNACVDNANLANKADFSKKPTDCKEAFENSAGKQWASYTNAALGVGIGTGIAAIALAAYWYRTREPTENKKIDISLNIDQRGGSALVTIPW